MKEFERLAKEEPEANVMHCSGIHYSEVPAGPNEDAYWVRKIYKDVRFFLYSSWIQITDLSHR
jgi:hypothetical protein